MRIYLRPELSSAERASILNQIMAVSIFLASKLTVTGNIVSYLDLKSVYFLKSFDPSVQPIGSEHSIHLYESYSVSLPDSALISVLSRFKFRIFGGEKK